MKLRNMHYPLVKLPSDTQIALFLIKEELKTRKLFQALHDAGLDDCYYQPHLDTLILQSVGVYDGTDETFELYTEIMDRRSKKIDMDHELIVKQAMKVYMELKRLKKELQGKEEE